MDKKGPIEKDERIERGRSFASQRSARLRPIATEPQVPSNADTNDQDQGQNSVESENDRPKNKPDE